MHRFLIPLLSLALLTPTLDAASPPSRDGAITAMRALPRRYQTGIIRMTGEAGRPNPASWTITARSTVRGDSTKSFRVSRGQVISERPSINPTRLVRDSSHISPHRVRIDSGDAWRRAQRHFLIRGEHVASADFSLRQRGANSDPVWTLTCFRATGRRIGSVSILASTGAIVPN